MEVNGHRIKSRCLSIGLFNRRFDLPHHAKLMYPERHYVDSAEVCPVKINWSVWLAACLWSVCSLRSSIAAEEISFTPGQIEFFEKQVRPLLVEHCQKCHNAEKHKGELRLDSREALLKGGETGPTIVAGKPSESELIKALKYDPDGYQMPPDGKLSDEKVAIFVQWIEMGAPWPAGESAPKDRLAPTGAEEFQRRSERYAFQPLKRVSPPPVRQTEWPRTPIDRFVLAQLEGAGQAPAAEADKRTWIRRVYLDTIGLPPSPEVVAAFLADEAPDAHECIVDELLSSPRFGERWGRHWLDLVRYAESRGHEFDYDVANPWHYRDYVIEAINGDLPYDEFVVEHIAGDLLDPEQSETPAEARNPRLRRSFRSAFPSLATGFWYFGEWVHSPVDIRKDETDRVDNMLDVFGKAFLGLTLGCARCHDHKFDPISQKDYYALAGYIQSTSYAQRPYETLDHNRRIRGELRELYNRAARPIGEAYLKSALANLRSPDEMLLAAREVLQRERGMATVFEDFESGTYGEWTSTGDAFGAEPQTQETIASYQGNVKANGKHFINSHQSRAGMRGDAHTGTLTSPEFPVSHDFLTFLVGGGSHPGQTCINLLIDGQAVLSTSGKDANEMSPAQWDLRPYRGKTARIQLVDAAQGGWGNIGADHFVFRDEPSKSTREALTQQISESRKVPAALLAKWVSHLEHAAKDASDPYHLWARYALGEIETASELKAELDRRMAQVQDQVGPISGDPSKVQTDASGQIRIQNQDGVCFSLPEEGTRWWLSNDPGKPIAKVAQGVDYVTLDPDFANPRMAPGSMSDVAVLGTLKRSGQTLRSESFTIEQNKIYAWVTGGFASYVVVDSHAVVNGPLHGSIIKKHPNEARWRWVEHDVSRYRGHRAHLEIIPEQGTEFALGAVLQRPEKPADGLPTGQTLQTMRELNSVVSRLLSSRTGDTKQDQSRASEVHRDGLNLDYVAVVDSPAPSHFSPTSLYIQDHPELFGLDTPEFRQELAAVARPFIEQRQALVAQIRSESAVAPIMLEGSASNEQLLIRGNSGKPNGTVPRRFMEVFHGHGPDESDPGSGRLDLARQLIDPEQTPVLSRVIVNRLWHHYFGRGIVATVDDFGHMGELPSNPELLDWLATELVKEDWSLKQIHRQILLSATYREGQGPRAAPRRLEGEIIRDTLFALSGRLDDRLYGPSVPIALNAFQDGRGKPASGPVDGAGRRSLYLSIRRNFPDSFLTAFDLPNAHTTMGRRSVSNVPAQALALLNSPMVLEQTKLWGARLCRDTEGLSPEARLDRLYQEAFSRLPTEAERASDLAFLRETAADTKLSEHDPRVWAELCHALVNTKEFFYVR